MAAHANDSTDGAGEILSVTIYSTDFTLLAIFL